MTSKKQWDDDEIREEIAAAVKIVAEDRERVRYRELHERYGDHVDPTQDDGDGSGKPPPKRDAPEGKSGKRRLYWGETGE